MLQPQPGNSRTVFVVQAEKNRDFSDARRFGELRAVFGRPRKPYDTRSMMLRARRVLRDWRPGDYLLMIGDPTLCGVCTAIASEQEDVINVLSWDREMMKYLPQRWDFGDFAELPDGAPDDDFETADD